MTAPPLITFLSDFGTADVYVGLCHAAIAQLAPGVRVVDLTHAVPPQDVTVGAARLADAVRFLPPAVHLAVVDPGVGSQRRGVALRTARGDWLVGPDNGLLSWAADELGGVGAAWSLHVAADASPTFHGRDVFAPAAGRLAADAARIGDVATRVDPAGLQPLARPPVRRTGDGVQIAVRDVDRFGDVQLFVRPDDPAVGRIRGPIVVGPAGLPAQRVRTFTQLEPGALGLLVDGLGWMSLARRDGDAATALAASPGDLLTLAPAPPREPGAAHWVA